MNVTSKIGSPGQGSEPVLVLRGWSSLRNAFGCGATEALRLAMTIFPVLLLGRGDLGLILVELVEGSPYEPALASGHYGALVRAKDNQKEKPDDHRLLYSDAEHYQDTCRRSVTAGWRSEQPSAPP